MPILPANEFDICIFLPDAQANGVPFTNPGAVRPAVAVARYDSDFLSVSVFTEGQKDGVAGDPHILLFDVPYTPYVSPKTGHWFLRSEIPLI